MLNRIVVVLIRANSTLDTTSIFVPHHSVPDAGFFGSYGGMTRPCSWVPASGPKTARRLGDAQDPGTIATPGNAKAVQGGDRRRPSATAGRRPAAEAAIPAEDADSERRRHAEERPVADRRQARHQGVVRPAARHAVRPRQRLARAGRGRERPEPDRQDRDRHGRQPGEADPACQRRGRGRSSRPGLRHAPIGHGASFTDLTPVARKIIDLPCPIRSSCLAQPRYAAARHDSMSLSKCALLVLTVGKAGPIGPGLTSGGTIGRAS